jgi:acyl dehydratase
VGDFGAGPRALTQRDFDRFAALSRDDNPIHVDPGFARGSHLGATVAHAMLLYGLIGAALSRRVAQRLPGGWLPLGQTLVFPSPAYVGDAVAADAFPADRSGGPLRYATRVRNQQGTTTAEGEALVTAAATGYGAAAIDDRFARGDLDSDPELLGLALGQSASAQRRFTATDLDEYVDLSGDHNPPVADRGAAAALGLPDRVLPGPLLAAMFSGLLGTRLPGPGCGWVRQRLVFHSPAHPGEPLTASVTVTRLRRDRQLVNLGCVLSAADGRSVATGEALVVVRNLGR